MSAPYWLQIDEDAIPDDVYGFIRFGKSVFTVPALPYVEMDDDDAIHFNGPLYNQVYGRLTFTPRGERVLANTLTQEPAYFDKLRARISKAPTGTLLPVASIISSSAPQKKKRKL
jgi:hypothetical protein